MLLGTLTALSLAAAAAANPSASIYKNIQADSQYSTLVSLVSQFPSLVSTLDGQGNITLFAPTNAAFNTLKTSQPKVYAAMTATPAALQDLLSYHTMAAAYQRPPTFPSYTLLQMSDNKRLLAYSNPSSSPNAVLHGSVFSQPTTSQPTIASNGAIVSSSAVLIPPQKPSFHLSSFQINGKPAFSRFAATADTVGGNAVIDITPGITILLPLDTAFEDLDNYLTANNISLTLRQISAIFDLHLVKGRYFVCDVIRETAYNHKIYFKTALNGTQLTVERNGNSAAIVGPQNPSLVNILNIDSLTIGDGNVLVIDQILLPDFSTIPDGDDDELVIPNFGDSSQPSDTSNPPGPVPTGKCY